VEVHPDPDRAMSDGAQSLDLPMFADLASRVHPGSEARSLLAV
jgi:3-deoxy-D-arabino-heptulosonate 7-phosphate (DAHP) synthase